MGANEASVFFRDGGAFLYGGRRFEDHFNISYWSLEVAQLTSYGYDRETIPALTTPQYDKLADRISAFGADQPCLVLRDEAATKAFPLSLMAYHEVINETAAGLPVMVAYCHLADLAKVYRRDYCGHTLTFAVSGYTYADPQIWEGKNGFVIWDRDTESLWWPLISKAVSGAMQHQNLLEMPRQHWERSTLAAVLADNPEALVLRARQDWTPPSSWPRLAAEDLTCR